MFKKSNIALINSYLLILFAFLLPINVGGANGVIALICILWLYEGNFRQKFDELKDNKLVIASLLFVLVHIIGLFWTSDIMWGLNIVKKEAIFLFLPIMMSVVKKEHIKYYFVSFLSAMTFSEIISYLVWFDIISLKNVSPENPTPFMSHSSYNPYLAFAIYLLLFFLLFDKSLSKKEKIISSIFVATMTVNMFITGGRAGQVVFFIMMIILLFQYFNKNILKTLAYAIVIFPIISVLFYNTSPIFKKRVDETITSIQTFQKQKNTLLASSLNLRIGFTVNAYYIWKDNILFGVGTGDFPAEYTKVNQTSDFKTRENTVHPHNMYMLVASGLGLFGLIVLLSIFYYQFRFYAQHKDFLSPIRLILPIMFIFINFSDSYLLGHFTTMLFLFFSAILYNKRIL